MKRFRRLVSRWRCEMEPDVEFETETEDDDVDQVTQPITADPVRWMED